MRVRGLTFTRMKPLRDLRVRWIDVVVEIVRTHKGAGFGDKPPVRQKVRVAADEALAEPIDGTPLREDVPPVALEHRAAGCIATVQSTRWVGRRGGGWRRGRWHRRRGWTRRREVGPVVYHVGGPANVRCGLMEANPRGPRGGVDRDNVWVGERREAVVLTGPGEDLGVGAVVDAHGASSPGGAASGGAGEGDHHARRPYGYEVLVRRLRRAARVPLRHLRVGVVTERVERLCRHGAVVRDKPPVRQKVRVAADEALAEPIDGTPLREDVPPVALEHRAAGCIATVQSTRWVGRRGGGWRQW